MADNVILLSSPPTRFVSNALERSFSGEWVRIVDPWKTDQPHLTIEDISAEVRGIINCSARTLIDAEYMKRFPQLRLISHHGVGYDNIDASWAGRHGIIVTHTPDVLTEDVADLAMGLLLATVRRIPQADRFVRQGEWAAAPFPLSSSLQGRTLGIVGLGRIGRAIARRAEAFGVSILYHGRHPQTDVRYKYFSDLKAMAIACDVLLVSAPASSATRNMIDGPILEALGANGILVNIARGSLVNEVALADALANKTILAAGLDVFADEPNVPDVLVSSDNSVLLPHIGSATLRTRKDMAELVVANVKAWLSGDGPLSPVPECKAIFD
ncbi:2-hydroxyacid dehydrogenase [Asticcacaulis machinosus]|uniref:2-hydroxyacid dehydrogenase n=1 Tax=Asticcacaulis machinosus TaxID=2984211 RepID=A0ABT5HF27_9CAUL|nr:2-hydroxyacid dehydrogenase [Asticcacaulis machinosus]MDC7674854.1 2-hydroxyacid dehydrogenase [Asticcacaulis machinosus]